MAAVADFQPAVRFANRNRKALMTELKIAAFQFQSSRIMQRGFEISARITPQTVMAEFSRMPERADEVEATGQRAGSIRKHHRPAQIRDASSGTVQILAPGLAFF